MNERIAVTVWLRLRCFYLSKSFLESPKSTLSIALLRKVNKRIERLHVHFILEQSVSLFWIYKDGWVVGGISTKKKLTIKLMTSLVDQIVAVVEFNCFLIRL